MICWVFLLLEDPPNPSHKAPSNRRPSHINHTVPKGLRYTRTNIRFALLFPLFPTTGKDEQELLLKHAL